MGLSPGTALRLPKIRLDGLHLGQIQGQQSLLTEVQKRLVVKVQGDRRDARRSVGARNRRRQERFGTVLPIGRCRDAPLVDQRVGEKIPHHALDVVTLQIALKQI